MTETQSLCRTCGDSGGWVLETDVDAATGLITSREEPCPRCRPAPRSRDDAFAEF
ncbi:hypothetical protein [Amycolatopsis viridis]|uniref:Small CPxCG-related zinc finger protein n=1 Tax=Amycolatopsis viridis TaxID=185678 RepID=A0ABX0SWY1_9PSEU|nr:hypothetical protein [Amycolatopsis viridis]NIH81481.1 hypothetical protein [Amycolatopsis viridis]